MTFDDPVNMLLARTLMSADTLVESQFCSHCERSEAISPCATF